LPYVTIKALLRRKLSAVRRLATTALRTGKF